jgi:7-carboxy-7-deazaguanine synthase
MSMNTNGSISQSSETPITDTAVPGATQSETETQSPSTSAKKFPVIEIFGPVIQGEGSQAGQQTMFIRFGGCDYRCGKCDSLHAVIPQAVQKHVTYMTAEEIAIKILEARDRTGVRWITFSGGNPCMHKLEVLVGMLTAEGMYINVETQGTLFQEWLNACTMVTVSPKSMGMGENFKSGIYTKFLSRLRAGIPLCVKVVVFSAQDFEFALHVKMLTDAANEGLPPTVAYYLSLGNPYPPVLDDDYNLVDNPAVTMGKMMSPEGAKPLVDTLLHDYQELSEEVLQDPRLKDFRFLPQLHVLIYGNESER